MSERVLGIEHPNTIQEYVSGQMEDLIFVMSCMFHILLNFHVCSFHLSDALGSVLLCQQPALNCSEASISRSLPHVVDLWGGPPRDGSAGCEWKI